MKLRLFHKLNLEEIAFYESKYGSHRFITSFHQFISGLNNSLYNKKPGNVYLKNNLLKQVQIAYSVPRTISLVTVSADGFYNLFPTDLHGEINGQYYIISLRQGGKAAQQVEETRCVLLSEVEPAIYKTVYSLGKNHMQPLKEKDLFPFSSLTSQRFNMPVPANSTTYRELEMIRYLDHGIHRIFLFKIISTQQLVEHPRSLAHIHGVYATWRLANNLESNYLIR